MPEAHKQFEALYKVSQESRKERSNALRKKRQRGAEAFQKTMELKTPLIIPDDGFFTVDDIKFYHSYGFEADGFSVQGTCPDCGRKTWSDFRAYTPSIVEMIFNFAPGVAHKCTKAVTYTRVKYFDYAEELNAFLEKFNITYVELHRCGEHSYDLIYTEIANEPAPETDTIEALLELLG